MEENVSQATNGLLFLEYRTSLLQSIPVNLLSHQNLTVKEMMDYVLRGKLPFLNLQSFKDEVDKLFQSRDFMGLDSKDKYDILEQLFPDHRNWFETIIAGESVWMTMIDKEFKNMEHAKTIEDFVRFLDEEKIIERLPQIQSEIYENFKVRKYKMKGLIREDIDNFFDSINVTDKCRQVVLVKPLEDKILYKLSNKFGDKMTKLHSQRSLIDIPGRKNKLSNYVGMTFTKNKRSSKVVTVFVEERTSRNPYEDPYLEIIFENLEDADGEVVLKYLQEAISDITSRGKDLKNTIRKTRFDVFDVELMSTSYNKEYIRNLLVHMSSQPQLSPLFFSENSNKIDDQKFILRTVNGKVRSRVEIYEKMVVFSSVRDIFDIFDLISLFVGYSLNRPSFDLWGLGNPIPKFEEREVIAQDSRYTMDVIEYVDGEPVLKKARFFESVFNKVCNKPENVPTFGEAIDATDPDLVFDYFPPEKLVKKLTESGKYEFPRYMSQRIPIQIYYGTGTRGKKEDKVRVLGRRTISRLRRDEMATSDNLSYIFGYFPCVMNIKASDYEKNKKQVKEQTYFISDMEEEEESGGLGDYIFDDIKDEIPLGRRGKTQLYFFDGLKAKVTNNILRTGVEESPYSFFRAVSLAKGGDEIPTIQDMTRAIQTDPSILQAGVAQFPDSKPREVEEFIANSVINFMDSRYFINIVAEFLNVNIIVLGYNSDPMIMDYAMYECPLGTIPPNVYEQLNDRRKTIILLRRKYQTLPDQYDFLIDSDPIQRVETALFDTRLVKEFLRKRVSFIDLSPEIADGGKTTRVIDLSSSSFRIDPSSDLVEKYQVIDSAGSRVGTITMIKDTPYPFIHVYPLAPNVGLPLATFSDLLQVSRPSLSLILREFDVNKISGAGYTRTGQESYLTSLMIKDDLILLCQPVLVTRDIQMLLKDTMEIETPDPYISKQFSVDSGFETILLKRKFMDIVASFLLQVLFLEILEHFIVKNSFETRTYREWRDNLFILEKNKSTPEKDDVIVAYMISEIKGLTGFIPPSPIQSLLRGGKKLATLFSNNGAVRCFSEEMVEKLDYQVSLFEKIIPSMGIRTNIPIVVYKIQGLYDNLVALSQSPESINGMGKRGNNDYEKWQYTCKTSFEHTNIYENIYKPFFSSSKDEPIIGFHGGINRGLWVIQTPSTETTTHPRYPVFDNTLPGIIYQKEREIDVFLPDNPENILHMKRII